MSGTDANLLEMALAIIADAAQRDPILAAQLAAVGDWTQPQSCGEECPSGHGSDVGIVLLLGQHTILLMENDLSELYLKFPTLENYVLMFDDEDRTQRAVQRIGGAFTVLIPGEPCGFSPLPEATPEAERKPLSPAPPQPAPELFGDEEVLGKVNGYILTQNYLWGPNGDAVAEVVNGRLEIHPDLMDALALLPPRFQVQSAPDALHQAFGRAERAEKEVEQLRRIEDRRRTDWDALKVRPAVQPTLELERIRREWAHNEHACANIPGIVEQLESSKASVPEQYHPFIDVAIAAQRVWLSYHEDMGVLLNMMQPPEPDHEKKGTP